MTDERVAEWARRGARAPGHEWTLRTGEGSVLASDGAFFDELVVDHWLHIEHLDAHIWWMRIGDARLHVTVEPDGRVRVDVERGAYGDVHGETEPARVR